MNFWDAQILRIEEYLHNFRHNKSKYWTQSKFGAMIKLKNFTKCPWLNIEMKAWWNATIVKENSSPNQFKNIWKIVYSSMGIWTLMPILRKFSPKKLFIFIKRILKSQRLSCVIFVVGNSASPALQYIKKHVMKSSKSNSKINQKIKEKSSLNFHPKLFMVTMKYQMPKIGNFKRLKSIIE